MTDEPAPVEDFGMVSLTITTPPPVRRPMYEFSISVTPFFGLVDARELAEQLEKLVRIAVHVESVWLDGHPEEVGDDAAAP